MAATESNNIVNRPSAAFIRLDDDGRHSRTHLACDVVYEVRLQRSHDRSAAKSRGGANGRPL